MVDIRDLGHVQLDALREVANIGAGHAATALSQLTNRRILVDVPRIRFSGVRDLEELTTSGSEEIATVSMQVLGDLTGRTVQIFPERTARRLAGILVGIGVVTDEFGELETSALKEAGNIIAGAYLNALSDFLGMLLLTSVPALRMEKGSMTSVMKDSPEAGDDLLLCMETEFKMGGDEEPMRGDFILIPDAASLQAMLEAINVD